jgi:hypothetical protein
MKYKKIGCILFLVLTLSSCASEEEKITRYMIGKWKTVYYKWELPTFQKKDTLIEYDVDYTNPGEERAKVTSFYNYKSDGSFETWQRNKSGASSSKESAKWHVTVDSLFHTYSRGNKSKTLSFGLQQIEDGFSVRAVFDQDKDGEKDDVYYMETLRMAADSPN